MTLINELNKWFAFLPSGLVAIESLPKDYPGYVVKDSAGYGVAISIGDDVLVSEHFANARMYTKYYLIDGINTCFLVLQSSREDLRTEFAAVCAQFLDPGKNGTSRKNLLENPLSWWETWKELLGNSINDSAVYSIIAEMLVLEHIYSSDKTVVWSKCGIGTHDLECDGCSCEVKSTIIKYGASVTISSQYQLSSDKPLYLYFCRLEGSSTGDCINSIVERLVNEGYDKDKLEHELLSRGYEIGASARTIKYDTLERRRYVVDDDFPKITNSSFVQGKLPDAITKITYTVDLDAISYTTW